MITQIGLNQYYVLKMENLIGEENLFLTGQKTLYKTLKNSSQNFDTIHFNT